MSTENFEEDDQYLRPYQPDLEDELEEDDEDEDLVADLDEAAADFRMRYYGPGNNPQPPAAMAELAPEVMRLVDAVVYGEIYNRPAVDLRTRSLCTIAALVVLGHSPQMIKRHITGALHIGVTEEEISEIIAQMVFYGGMPAAVNAFRIAKETFDEQAERQGAEARPERAPRDTPSGYAPPYRRENVGGYAPGDLSEEEQPRVRLREQQEQDDRGPAPGDRPQRGPGSGDRPQRGPGSGDRPQRGPGSGDRPQRGPGPGDRPQRGPGPGDRPQRGPGPGDRPQRGPGPGDRPQGPGPGDRPQRRPWTRRPATTRQERRG